MLHLLLAAQSLISVFLVRPAGLRGRRGPLLLTRVEEDWRFSRPVLPLAPRCGGGSGQKRRLRRDRSHAQAAAWRASMARTHLLSRTVAAPQTGRMTARPGFRNVPTPGACLGVRGWVEEATCGAGGGTGPRLMRPDRRPGRARDRHPKGRDAAWRLGERSE